MFPVQSQGAVDIIAPTQALTVENAGQFVETVQRRLSEGQPKVVLDMSAVPLLDSAGLESLLDVRGCLQEKGGAIKLASLSALCKDILRVTGIDGQFDAYRDVKSAVGSFVR